MDYGAVVKNSLTMWFKDKQTTRYVLILALIAIIFLVLFLAIGLLLFGDVLGQLTQLSAASATSPEPSGIPGSIVQQDQGLLLIASLLSGGILFVLIFVPLFFIMLGVLMYISVSMQVRAIQVVGFETGKFGVMKFIKLILLAFYVELLAVTSWYHKKFRMLFFAIVGLYVISILGSFVLDLFVLLALLASVLMFIYYFIIIYNSYRLFLAPIVYLHKDQGIAASCKEAWDLAENNVLKIFIAYIVTSIAVGIVLVILYFVFLIVGFGVSLVLSNPLFVFIIFYLLFAGYVSIAIAISVYIMPNIYAQLKGQQPAPVSAQPTQGVSRREQRMVARNQGSTVGESMQKQNTSASAVPQPSAPSTALTPTDEINVQKLVKLLQPQVNDYSKDELVMVMNEKGYGKTVIAEVLKRIGK
ncbi:hypothetical protein IIC68_01355 [archaeon]|nr:hypothetical protein [archaeon]